MKREVCPLGVIASLLLASFLIPEYSYSPPATEFVNSNFHVFEEHPSGSAYIECLVNTPSYYHHVVNWTLTYPHDYGFSRPGYFKTWIAVKDWKSFYEEIPYGCGVVEAHDLGQNSPLHSAALRLKNITAGTEDYAKLEPFFEYAEHDPAPTGNWTLARITVLAPDVMVAFKRPFAAVWAGVAVLSLIGVLLNIRGDKIVLVGFLVLLVLGALFVGEYIKDERHIQEKEQVFKQVLALNSTGGECGMIMAGVSADFKPEDIPWFIMTVEQKNSSITSVEWEDYTVRISVSAPFDNYKELLKEFEGRGWEISAIEIDPSAFRTPPEEMQRLNGTIQTLLKYLPLLPSDEREEVKEYIEGLNNTIRRDMARNRFACIEVVTSTPDAFLYIYKDWSDFFAKVALLVAGMTVAATLRR